MHAALSACELIFQENQPSLPPAVNRTAMVKNKACLGSMTKLPAIS